MQRPQWRDPSQNKMQKRDANDASNDDEDVLSADNQEFSPKRTQSNARNDDDDFEDKAPHKSKERILPKKVNRSLFNTLIADFLLN